MPRMLHGLVLHLAERGGETPGDDDDDGEDDVHVELVEAEEHEDGEGHHGRERLHHLDEAQDEIKVGDVGEREAQGGADADGKDEKEPLMEREMRLELVFFRC